MTSLMLKEIHQQPKVLERTIGSERKKMRKLASFLKDRDISLIVLVARGSSDNAALFGRYLLEITTGIPVSLSAPSVQTLYKSKLDLSRALVVGISQSGEGSDINEVILRSKKQGAFTLGITNSRGSTLSQTADETMYTHAGLEKSVAATKTYTGQMLHFYLLAEALTENDLDMDLGKIPGYVEKALELEPQVAELAERYAFVENCVVVGRGLNYGNSFELALKLMETCYVVAERFSSADFFHGPLAIVERRFPVIMFAADGVTNKGIRRLLKSLKEKGADSLCISNSVSISKNASRCVLLPEEIEEKLSPIPFIVPGQLFAAHLSTVKGLNPDKPRSLSKVTKTL